MELVDEQRVPGELEAVLAVRFMASFGVLPTS